MKQIIQDLVLKARSQATSDEPGYGKSFNLDRFHEIFAHLIVKECLHIVDDEGAGEDGCIRAMIRIQEQFGVD